jgi:ActR/RegA family two-component response regulator
VVDLRLTDGSGLDVVPQIRKAREDCRIVMLTGYGNIATAVVAIKAGAIDYLPKPADADQVEAALLDRKDALPPPPEQPMTADRVRWEHIQRVYEQCDRNVSEPPAACACTAGRCSGYWLSTHRRVTEPLALEQAERSTPTLTRPHSWGREH